ncbi:DMT family transporter [Alphaproteobacteria bacterium US3C007]|nr:DMT family transporter [Alphaproteobacteria bacterium US3C007]
MPEPCGGNLLNASLEVKAKLACLYAGAVWGLFWIPLRALEDAGIHGLWITVVYFLIPTICITPVTLKRWKHVKKGGLSLQLTAMLSGGALLLYSTSIVYTDVVRAMLLFYLTPIWATILARIFLNDAISPSRILAMAMAILGMLTIFGLGARFPIPQNIGDWLGIASGVLWAIATVRLRMSESHSAIELTAGFFQWSLIFSASAAFLLAPAYIPKVEQALPALPLLLIFMALLVLPGTYASLWGPKYLSPGIVGLLFMTEIVVGAISVALLAGEPFGIRELTGVLLIAGASMLEPLLALRRPRRNLHPID